MYSSSIVSCIRSHQKKKRSVSQSNVKSNSPPPNSSQTGARALNVKSTHTYLECGVGFTLPEQVSPFYRTMSYVFGEVKIEGAETMNFWVVITNALQDD